MADLYRSVAMITALFACGCAMSAPDVPLGLPESGLPSPAERIDSENSTGSLFKEDQAVLGNEAIEQILAQKVAVPPSAKLAVVRFGQLPYWWGWSEEFARTNERMDADLLARLQQSRSLREVAYLPTLVTPANMTIPYLRQAAARFQADLLLVYRTTSRTYERSRLFAQDEVKAYCTVEAILLDTRTGIVPFSTIVTEHFSAHRERSDLEFRETINRAEQQAIAQAWLRMADAVSGHLAQTARQ